MRLFFAMSLAGYWHNIHLLNDKHGLPTVLLLLHARLTTPKYPLDPHSPGQDHERGGAMHHHPGISLIEGWALPWLPLPR